MPCRKRIQLLMRPSVAVLQIINICVCVRGRERAEGSGDAREL